MEKQADQAIGQRIRARREELGITQKQLADAVGYRQQTIQSIEAGDTLRPGKIFEIAKALKIAPAVLLSAGADLLDQGDQPNEYVRPQSGILEIDVRAGLGGGGTIDTPTMVNGDYVDAVKDESWHFPSRFVREELRATESRIIILETAGDSMFPTISSGDRVIVDTGHRVPAPDGIYAIRDRYDGIQVKRLQVLRRGDPPRILVISDNDAHQDEEVGADEISIVGRVLWGLKRL